jgi:hypothetical protein
MSQPRISELEENSFVVVGKIHAYKPDIVKLPNPAKTLEREAKPGSAIAQCRHCGVDLKIPLAKLVHRDFYYCRSCYRRHKRRVKFQRGFRRWAVILIFAFITCAVVTGILWFFEYSKMLFY